ncbi:MAG: aconitase family protein, partial [Holophagae bacterium]
NACGPCIGQWHREDISEGAVNSIISSFNRNFAKRNDGNPQTNSFISSPEIVIAYALAGSLTVNPLDEELQTGDGNSYRLEPPRPAPEVPERGFIFKAEGYLGPPEDRAAVEVKVTEGSERLQLLEPFPPWDGSDYERMPILLKARGKCTTDHISQAGPWLRFRGHLDNISDNLFLGANNSFADEAGHGVDIESGEVKLLPKLAREYKERGTRWVAVADENYGEGSSREHAAMQPRHMAGTAVIARSFARIAETNLKKQGMLPLTFSNPADYDLIRVDDRLSLVGLADLEPGRELTAVVQHADGSEDRIQLRHSLNDEQVEWFKAGSALNLLRAKR